MGVVEEICGLFAARGSAAYFGEPVSQQEHALQAAWLAEEEGTKESLVVAAVLHDIGHLLHGLPETIAEEGTDAHHEEIGHAWLRRHFGPEVTEPVRLHVAAKRYLCAVEPEYFAQLSPASVQSLELQGGPMTAEEVTEFEANPFGRDAVLLRRWDDRAKISGWEVPDLEHYHVRLEAAVQSCAEMSESVS
jgi:[1-hydroxy-2-(trimethylamino)ethyl]phosphonate dioxygenase